MNKFKQKHRRGASNFPSLCDIECCSVVNGHEYVSGFNLPIDQFFSQLHRLKNGFIDTSPAVIDDVQAASHISPMDAETPLSNDLSDSDIHDMILPKHCQSAADMSKVKALRPNESNFQEDEDIVNEPAQQVVNE